MCYGARLLDSEVFCSIWYHPPRSPSVTAILSPCRPRPATSDHRAQQRKPSPPENPWHAILAKRGLAVVVTSLAAGDMIGAGPGAEYRLYETGLKENPSRAYIKDW